MASLTSLDLQTPRQLCEPPKHAAPLGPDVALAAAHMEHPAEAIELRLIDPVRIMQQGGAGDRDDRLDGGNDLAGSWAHAGSWAAR
jgi:hypothetical protein